jgi:hypothetical protein
MRIVWNAGLPVPHTVIQVPPECVTAKESDMFIEHSQPPERDPEPSDGHGWLAISVVGAERGDNCNEPAELPEGPEPNEPGLSVDLHAGPSDASAQSAADRGRRVKGGRRRIGE